VLRVAEISTLSMHNRKSNRAVILFDLVGEVCSNVPLSLRPVLPQKCMYVTTCIVC
jgi:hypothetical protein